MIAPCGMNCATCLAYLRDKNTCSGCWGDTSTRRESCRKCRIKNCIFLNETESKFCYDCSGFPCRRLKQLDKRYQTRYQVSFIKNLLQIKHTGLENFIESENEKWRCPECGGTVCVHRGICLKCAMRPGYKSQSSEQKN